MDHIGFRQVMQEVVTEIVAALRPRELTRAEEVERLAERLYVASFGCESDISHESAFDCAEGFIKERDRRRAERDVADVKAEEPQQSETTIESCPVCDGEGGDMLGFTGDDAGCGDRGAILCKRCDGEGYVERDDKGNEWKIGRRAEPEEKA